MSKLKCNVQAGAKADVSSGLGLGEILLLVSLACDGITGAIQATNGGLHFSEFYEQSALITILKLSLYANCHSCKA